MGTKLDRVMTFLQRFQPIKSHTTTILIATKPGRVTTYQEGLPLTTSYDL